MFQNVCLGNCFTDLISFHAVYTDKILKQHLHFFQLLSDWKEKKFNVKQFQVVIQEAKWSNYY